MDKLDNSIDAKEALIVFTQKEQLSLNLVQEIATNRAIFERYKEKYPYEIYTLLIFSLCHELFLESQCRIYWHNLLEHYEFLNARLARDVGITVAAADYLSNLEGCIKTPRIISEQKSEVIKESATRDSLTGLFIRTVFDAALKKQCQQTKSHNVPFSLVMIDIDDFKMVNDRHGHICGDRILTAIGKCILDCIREYDMPVRYGGEELAIILPRTNLQVAYDVAERLRKAVEACDTDGICVTVSIGVAESLINECTPDQLVRMADHALYQSKNNGKNRVTKFME